VVLMCTIFAAVAVGLTSTDVPSFEWLSSSIA
jgi:hypothetical protein